MGQSPDYYSILGLARDASQEEIKRAYLNAAQRLHPDKNVAPGETELFLETQRAYEVLSNPKRREKYDASLPREERPEGPIEFDVLYSRPSLVRLQEPQLIYALLEARPPASGEKISAPPLNVCLALDRSTSMKDEKMDLLKAAAIQFLRGMRPEDAISLVTFSDNAEVVIPSSFQADRQRLEAQIRNIQASGATELYKGLKAGVDEVRRGVRAGRVNHVILLTDGHTYGDEEACLTLAAEAAQQGIGISVMGIGADWNDSFLDQVAGRTGNTSHYVARPQDIQKYLNEKFHALTRVFADEALLEYKAAEGVSLNYAFRLQPEAGPLSAGEAMRLGPILRDTHLSVVFEFLIQPEALASFAADAFVFLEGNLKASIAMRPVPAPPMRVRFSRPVSATADATPPSLAILQALSRLTLYRMQERARAQTQAGEFDKATRSLKYLASRLLAQGQQSLAKTVLLEAENVSRMHGLSQEGEKEIKYATRALM
ncbi:MAG: VWA domain-containing protein [Chloroflexota bacterium]